MVPAQSREPPRRPVRSAAEKARWFIPSSPSLAWCRMYRPVRTATEPVRLSRKNVRTATEPAIRPARRRFRCHDSGRYRQRPEHPYPRKGRAGHQRRSERRSAGRGSCIQTSDFPETGYGYLLYGTDQFPGSSIWAERFVLRQWTVK